MKFLCFFFNDTATTEIYTLSLHDALPIFDCFSQWMRDAITDAGLPLDCQPHGLRKATGRRLAEAGATAKMIMAILGHTTLAETERYTEEADQVWLAEDAVIKLE